jgi:predicted DNA-binding transcriptional regulator AlpA
MNKRLTDPEQLRELEPMRVIMLPEVAKLLGISVSTVIRNFPEQIIRISPRRRGMRVRDILAIGKSKG